MVPRVHRWMTGYWTRCPVASSGQTLRRTQTCWARRKTWSCPHTGPLELWTGWPCMLWRLAEQWVGCSKDPGRLFFFRVCRRRCPIGCGWARCSVGGGGISVGFCHPGNREGSVAWSPGSSHLEKRERNVAWLVYIWFISRSLEVYLLFVNTFFICRSDH